MSQNTAIKVFDLAGQAPELSSELEAVGIRVDYLRQNADEQLGLSAHPPFMPLPSLVPSRAIPSDENELRLLRTGAVQRWPYIVEFFTWKGMLAVDPFSGELLVSVHSYSIDEYHIAYQFNGTTRFFLFVGRWRGEKLGLLVPHCRIMVLFPFSERTPAMVKWTAGLGGVLEGKLQTAKGLSERPQERGLGIQIGCRPNLGHYVWQELSGIETIIRMFGPQAISAIVIGKYAPMDPVSIFPELESARQTRITDHQNIFSNALETRCQLIRPVESRIRNSLRTRILDVMTSLTERTVLDRIDAITRERRTLWLNIRAHNKVWIRQIEGYANIVAAIAAEFGAANLAIVLDGFADAAGIADSLIPKLPLGVVVVNTLGCALPESIVWANRVDAYCAVVGSGLVINSWLARAPGVAHGNSAHLAQERIWSAVSEGTEAPYFIPQSAVTADPSMYGNYDFDERLVVRPLTDYLARNRR